ncbi:neuropeptide receptor 15-like [Physella acuta]|uniref:neuropeptide receptor 15-like n=1 Tax=Physella acuta TaxID=109671 RepID=UPI0027DD4E8E|nr:neuropeptide receptor 15-like [Physella acuta]
MVPVKMDKVLDTTGPDIAQDMLLQTTGSRSLYERTTSSPLYNNTRPPDDITTWPFSFPPANVTPADATSWPVSFSQDINTTVDLSTQSDIVVSLAGTVGLSLLFFAIVFIGIIGNCLVIVVILTDQKMRQSVTNLLIINLAMADLIIMVFGVPEIVMFMMSRGWLLGSVACKVNRYILVVALYSSVISLVVLCIERFIGIVFPLKVYELCTRKKMIGVIFVIWPVSFSCGLPVVIYNEMVPSLPGIHLCQITLPGEDRLRMHMIYRYLESALFYFLPLAIQIVLYSIISKRLFASNHELSTRLQMRSTANRTNDSTNDTIKARRGVVKMLISSVVLYMVSYSPTQVHLIYSTFARSSVLDSWEFFVFVMVVTHINSAANPVLYGIFSQNFRRNFKRCLCWCRSHKNTRTIYDSLESRLVSMRSSSTAKTYVSKL